MMNVRKTIKKKTHPTVGFFKTPVLSDELNDALTYMLRFLTLRDTRTFSFLSKQYGKLSAIKLDKLKKLFATISDTTIENKTLEADLLNMMELNALNHQGWIIINHLIEQTAYQNAISNKLLTQQQFDDFFSLKKSNSNAFFNMCWEDPYAIIESTIKDHQNKIKNTFLKILQQPLPSDVLNNLSDIDFKMCFTLKEFSKLQLDHAMLQNNHLFDINIADSTFQDADFTDSSWKQLTFTNSNFSHATFKNEIEYTGFKHCNFMSTNCSSLHFKFGVSFENIHFNKTNFIETNLTDAKLEQCAFNEVIFFTDPISNEHITKLYILWNQATDKIEKESLKQIITLFYRYQNINKESLAIISKNIELKNILAKLIKYFQFEESIFLETDFLYAIYGQQALKTILSQNSTIQIDFKRATLDHKNYDDYPLANLFCIDSSLSNSSFFNANLISAYFLNSRITKCDFTKANLNNVRFGDSTLKQANFSDQHFDNVSFTKCELSECNMQNIQFRNGMILETNVHAIDFFKSNFIDTQLRNVKFYLCHFNNTNIFECHMENVTFYECKLPLKSLLELDQVFTSDYFGRNTRFHQDDNENNCCKEILLYACAYREKLTTEITTHPLKLAITFFDHFRNKDVFERYRAQHNKNCALFERVLNAVMCNEFDVSIEEMALIHKQHSPLWNYFLTAWQQNTLPEILEEAVSSLAQGKSNKMLIA